jgi:hypothetical protein
MTARNVAVMIVSNVGSLVLGGDCVVVVLVLPLDGCDGGRGSGDN